ncbi:MAG TPA: peptidoglycan editing factor PgeF [Xenococcaceae cyanobacterium]
MRQKVNQINWDWQKWQGLPYLTCDLLAPWRHGFFTRQCYPQTPEQLVAALDPQAKTYRVKQVHGNLVLTPEIIISTQKPGSSLTPGDGIITTRTQQAPWVASADCNPVLIGDIKTGKVAAIHAGWRGTAQKIVPNAIAQLQNYGSNLSDLRIAIGPAISGEVYQVSETVATEVGQTIVTATGSDILLALKQLPNSPLLEDAQPKRVRLDLRKVNALQLQQLGIKNSQIAIAPYCTYQQPDYFFSYRRSQEKKVQWSGIVSF